MSWGVRACAVAGLGLTVATCRDGMEPQVHMAPIAVAPVLPSDAALASFGLAIDRVRFIVVRPAAPPDTLADTTVALPPDSTTLDLDLRVPLIAAAETLQVSVIVLSGTIELFQGTAAVEVVAGGAPTTPTEIPVQTYVGPGASVDSIAIFPTLPFLFLNDSLRFQVEAFQAGVPVTQFYVAWSTSDPLLPMNGIGLLRAPATRGSVRVRARTPSGATDSVAVTFVPVPTQLVITDGTAQSGIAGQTLEAPLEVEARGSDNLPVGGVGVRFQAPSGGAPADSTVLSDANGRARVVARLGPTAGVQSFRASLPAFPGVTAVTFGATALAGAIGSVAVTPPSATLDALSAAQPFAAQAFDVSGNPVSGATFTWATSDTLVASVDNAGLATALANGTVTISATADGVTGAASLTVAQAMASVTVSPQSATLHSLNDTEQLTAHAVDRLGNSLVPQPTFTWSATNTLVARVNQGGLATSLANGLTRIVAMSGGIADTADLTVQQVVASVVVTPDPVLLTAAGETVQLTAEARDSGGSAVSGATFMWSSSNPLAGTVDATGLVTAVANGTTDISAAMAAVQGVARVTVNLLGAATRLVFVMQPPSPVFFGDTFTVQVAAQDDLGNTITTFRGNVFLSENAGSMNPVSKLGGTLTQAAVNGIATFNGLFVDGTDTTAIDALADGLASATSSQIAVVDQIVLTEGDGIGKGAYFAGVDTVTNRVYVSNTSGSSASAVEAATHKVVKVIGLGPNPGWESVNPVTKRVFISDFLDGLVYIIDESQDLVEGTISVGPSATQPAVNPVGDTIYLPAQQDGLSLVIVDMATRKQVGAVPIGGTSDNAGGAVWDQATGLVWVVIESQTSIKSVDPVGLRVVDSIFVGEAPYGIALDPVLKRLYVTLSGQSQVFVLDLVEKIALQPINVGSTPQGLSVDAATGRVFVANFDDGVRQGTISVIDGTRGEVIKTITVGVGPGDAEYNPRTRLVYVPNGNDNSLSIVKPN